MLWCILIWDIASTLGVIIYCTFESVLNRCLEPSRQIDRVTPMNKSFEKVANYSTALMTFKAIQKICPSYLSKRFILCGNGGEHDAQGVNTRAGPEKKSVCRELGIRSIRKYFCITPQMFGIVFPLIFVKLSL